MSEIDMSTIMEAIADALIDSGITRAFAWPIDTVTVPCAVVGYPTSIDFDYTFSRGSDHAVFPVYFITGRISDRTTRDELSKALTGVNGIKNAIDGTLSDTVSMARVTDASVTQIEISSINYAALQVNVEIVS